MVICLKLLRLASTGNPATLLALLVVLPSCQRPTSSQIDLVIRSDQVITLDDRRPTAKAIAIAGGVIQALSDTGIPAAWLRSGAEVADLGGAVVAPALVDHHVHLLNVGLALLNRADGGRLALDLSAVRSLDQVAHLVRARARATPPGTWIVGTGWSQANWGASQLPSHELLTQAAPRHPVFLVRTDGHAGWANETALRVAGIGATTPDPPGGFIGRARGDPNGVLLERANEAVVAVIPPPSDEDVSRAYRLAAEALSTSGVVEVCDAGPLAFPGVVALNADFGRFYRLLRRADSALPLPLRINLMIPAPSRFSDSLLKSDGPLVWSPRIRVSHIKLFVDGALGSRGASLSHPYADAPASRGVARMSAESISALARAALDRGLDVSAHAIGDAGVGLVLDAFDQIKRARPTLAPGRLRIEHFSYASTKDADRAIRAGIVLSVQSNFNAGADDSVSLGTTRVGPHNEPRVYPWKTLAGLGASLVEGSDYFGLPGAPLAGFSAVLAGRYTVAEGLVDSVARRTAYRAVTARLGSSGVVEAAVIRVGAKADLVAWTANPLTAPRSGLAEIRAVRTFPAGGFLPASH